MNDVAQDPPRQVLRRASTSKAVCAAWQRIDFSIHAAFTQLPTGKMRNEGEGPCRSTTQATRSRPGILERPRLRSKGVHSQGPGWPPSSVCYLPAREHGAVLTKWLSEQK